MEHEIDLVTRLTVLLKPLLGNQSAKPRRSRNPASSPSFARPLPMPPLGFDMPTRQVAVPPPRSRQSRTRPPHCNTPRAMTSMRFSPGTPICFIAHAWMLSKQHFSRQISARPGWSLKRHLA